MDCSLCGSVGRADKASAGKIAANYDGESLPSTGIGRHAKALPVCAVLLGAYDPGGGKVRFLARISPRYASLEEL